jgi:hypothetical protein
MRGTVRHLVAILGAGLLVGPGAGCTSLVQVDADDGVDFATYRTWNWLPYTTRRVDAPLADERALDARLARLIEEALLREGFERSAKPDFFVAYHFSLRRRSEVVNVPMAPYLLSSHHFSPSYWVEGSRRTTHHYEALKLSIGFTPGGAHLPWRAVWVTRVEDGDILPLDAAVDDLLSRFPSHPDESD